jgi:DNA-directed RNA polymerase subunit L
MLPHPLLHVVRLKLQTNSSAVSPIEVLSAAIEDLGNETDYLTENTTDAIAKWKKENASGGVMDQF